MKKIFLLLIIVLSACSSQPPLFSGDPSAPLSSSLSDFGVEDGTSLSSLPEGQEIRVQGILEKNFSKTGSYEYRTNGVWLTFDDDHVIADDFVGKTVTVKGTVHHFNNCPLRQDPNMPEQCAIADQLRVNMIE